MCGSSGSSSSVNGGVSDCSGSSSDGSSSSGSNSSSSSSSGGGNSGGGNSGGGCNVGGGSGSDVVCVFTGVRCNVCICWCVMVLCVYLLV